MHGDEPSATDADGADFSGTCFTDIQPDSRSTCHAFGMEVEACEEADDGLFEGFDIGASSEVQRLKVEDGITGDLAGAVIRDVSSAIGVVEGYAATTEHVFRDE